MPAAAEPGGGVLSPERACLPFCYTPPAAELLQLNLTWRATATLDTAVPDEGEREARSCSGRRCAAVGGSSGPTCSDQDDQPVQTEPRHAGAPPTKAAAQVPCGAAACSKPSARPAVAPLTSPRAPRGPPLSSYPASPVLVGGKPSRPILHSEPNLRCQLSRPVSCAASLYLHYKAQPTSRSAYPALLLTCQPDLPCTPNLPA